jgi:hypothetical protein
VVGEDAVGESMQLGFREAVQAPRALRDQLLPERDVADQRARLAQRDLRPQLELERLAGVVEDRGREEQVGVEPRMERARLERQRGHGHRVLEEPAEVCVVPGARARGAPEVLAERRVSEERVEQRAQVGVVDLTGKMLEEAVELLHVAVGDRQELGRVRHGLGRAPDRFELDLKLVPEPLYAPLYRDKVTPFELAGEEVGVPEGASRYRSGAVAQLDREVRRAVPRRQAVLPRAREHTLDLTARSQLRNRHVPILIAGSDVGYGEVDDRCDLAGAS